MALLPNRNILDGTKSPATTTSDMKTALGSLRDYLAGLLGTDSTNLVAARAALDCGQGTYGSRGLVGKVNTTTPLTKYDLSADAVMLRNATGGVVTQYSVATLTCDLGLAGSAANGRDQAAVFGVSQWVYLYFIWNGSTISTLASLSAPPTAPTLPSGYTHWCFATALRWNASSNIVPGRVQGSTFWYDLADGGVNRVMSGGNATSMTAIGCAGFVPPNVVLGVFNANGSGADTTAPLIHSLYLRPTGASNAGQIVTSTQTVTNLVAVLCFNTFHFPLGASQQIDYKFGIAYTNTSLLTIDVVGFTQPNGAS